MTSVGLLLGLSAGRFVVICKRLVNFRTSKCIHLHGVTVLGYCERQQPCLLVKILLLQFLAKPRGRPVIMRPIIIRKLNFDRSLFH